ncbi:MAG: BON domain-containing protein [Candidatus Eisenbacteria bacterium]|nr:BON domain-containing protein [Candidatus Eisenbacteria bacterium]
MATRTRSDVELKDDILNELKWEPSIQEAGIGVIVESGIVTLSGAVESWATRSAAEEATQRVTGVAAVANELTVRLTTSYERTDADIAGAAAGALHWHVSLPRDRVRVTVENGRVTLRGELDWQFQKATAAEAVAHLWGVTSVVNEIVLKPRVSPEDLKRKILVAIERNALLDVSDITVEAQGGRVVLKGRVRTWAEKDQACQTAWAAPGVTDVDNQLRVTY